MKAKSGQDGWREFIELMANLPSEKQFSLMCELFFTIEEKETLASRYRIVKALVSGELTQRQIAEECEVSISQITRGSNALKIIGPQLRKYLENFVEHHETK
jgi:TrpR family trp operon transcriptional repressor